MYVDCSAQKFFKTNSTCVIQRKVSITVLAIGAILLNLKRFVIYVSCDQVLLTPTYQVSLCYIPCIAVSCKTGFSNISIREERKTYEERIYVGQILKSCSCFRSQVDTCPPAQLLGVVDQQVHAVDADRGHKHQSSREL